ncbi:HAD family acid phosphatase [Streptomyces sp. HMX112]|uniref:HAD family acid phosphatase n=1 Tax=Streptomyces sp. HMX112 TaxID=3390850 RepID=UPI003A8078E5
MNVRRWRTRAATTVAATAVITTAMSATTASGAASTAPVQTRIEAGAHATAAARQQAGSAALAGVDYRTWQRDVAAVIGTARPYIEQRTSAAPSGRKLAIVLDIDNTSLETDFHFFWEYPTPAVKPVLDLARYAHSRGVDVFFVTARPGIVQAPTAHNLRAVGYPVTGLYVRDLPDLFEEVSRYKTEKRGEIEAMGYTVIANIGNRPTDLVGGHAEKTFKLPDYDGRLS